MHVFGLVGVQLAQGEHTKVSAKILNRNLLAV